MQAQRVVDEIRSGISLLDSEEVEGFARSAWARVPENDVGLVAVDVEVFARAQGCVVVHDNDLPDGFDGLVLPPSKIIVRPHRLQAVQSFRVIHELGHWVLRDVAHTHSDVWRTAIAIALPYDRARQSKPGLCVPDWALKLRWLMLAEAGFFPAA